MAQSVAESDSIEVMSNANISISLITQSSSEYSISFCIQEKDAARAQQLLEDVKEMVRDSKSAEGVEIRQPGSDTRAKDK